MTVIIKKVGSDQDSKDVYHFDVAGVTVRCDFIIGKPCIRVMFKDGIEDSIYYDAEKYEAMIV
jgi:DNA primase